MTLSHMGDLVEHIISMAACPARDETDYARHVVHHRPHLEIGEDPSVPNRKDMERRSYLSKIHIWDFFRNVESLKCSRYVLL